MVNLTAADRHLHRLTTAHLCTLRHPGPPLHLGRFLGNSGANAATHHNFLRLERVKHLITSQDVEVLSKLVSHERGGLST